MRSNSFLIHFQPNASVFSYLSIYTPSLRRDHTSPRLLKYWPARQFNMASENHDEAYAKSVRYSAFYAGKMETVPKVPLNVTSPLGQDRFFKKAQVAHHKLLRAKPTPCCEHLIRRARMPLLPYVAFLQ